jgi:hypothetical protein
MNFFKLMLLLSCVSQVEASPLTIFKQAAPKLAPIIGVMIGWKLREYHENRIRELEQETLEGVERLEKQRSQLMLALAQKSALK